MKASWSNFMAFTVSNNLHSHQFSEELEDFCLFTPNIPTPPPQKKTHKKQKPTKASWTCLEKGTVLSRPPHDKVYMHNMHRL